MMIGFKAFLVMRLLTVDTDYDGSSTYLLEVTRGAAGKMHIAYSGPSLGEQMREGATVYADVVADCETGIDPQVGKFYICNAQTLSLVRVLPAVNSSSGDPSK